MAVSAPELGEFGFAGDDRVVPFQVEGLDVRGRAVQLGPILDTILTRHDYPLPVAKLLAETIVLTVLIGTSLKFEGKFTVQTKGDGPVDLLVVDFRTPESVRAYARFDEAAVQEAVSAGRTEPQQLLGTGNVQTASLGGPETFSSLKGMFDMTFNSLTDNAASQPMQQALADLALSRQPNQSIELRPMDLVAPEIDHVNDTLVQPVPMSTAFWAEMTEAEGYLEKGTELGPLTGRVAFLPDNAAIPAYDRFVTDGLQLVAQR